MSPSPVKRLGLWLRQLIITKGKDYTLIKEHTIFMWKSSDLRKKIKTYHYKISSNNFIKHEKKN